ncbi:MAG: IS1182 family transposase [Nitrospirota bacterium]
MAYIIEGRNQLTFFPPTIEEYVGENDPVRVYDAFVNALNFSQLGIVINAIKAGAKEYHPKVLLKIIVYGYSYGIRSSRKLERACHHNLSFMWLTGGLKPDYRTIGRFRKANKSAIKQILKQNAKLCIELGLIEGNSLFVDGSKFRANAGINNSWDKKRCVKYLKKAEENIERIMEEAEQLDRLEEESGSLVRLAEDLLKQKEVQEKIKKIASTIEHTGQTSVNTTDTGSVKAKGRQGTHASYNAQIVVDEKHGFIVNTEVVSQNNDKNQLSDQIDKTIEVLEKKPESVTCDSGYHSLVDIDKVPEEIKVIMPGQQQVQKERQHGELKPFSKEEFTYDAINDEYICPEGAKLKNRGNSVGKPRETTYRAPGKECSNCVNFGVCTKSKGGRTVVRMKEEELMQELEEIYESTEGQETYKLRKEKVELPFGHIKSNLGAGQFMLRGREEVNAEFSILSTCFNISRMITLIGIPELTSRLKRMSKLRN